MFRRSHTSFLQQYTFSLSLVTNKTSITVDEKLCNKMMKVLRAKSSVYIGYNGDILLNEYKQSLKETNEKNPMIYFCIDKERKQACLPHHDFVLNYETIKATTDAVEKLVVTEQYQQAINKMFNDVLLTLKWNEINIPRYILYKFAYYHILRKLFIASIIAFVFGAM